MIIGSMIVVLLLSMWFVYCSLKKKDDHDSKNSLNTIPKESLNQSLPLPDQLSAPLINQLPAQLPAQSSSQLPAQSSSQSSSQLPVQLPAQLSAPLSNPLSTQLFTPSQFGIPGQSFSPSTSFPIQPYVPSSNSNSSSNSNPKRIGTGTCRPNGASHLNPSTQSFGKEKQEQIFLCPKGTKCSQFFNNERKSCSHLKQEIPCFYGKWCKNPTCPYSHACIFGAVCPDRFYGKSGIKRLCNLDHNSEDDIYMPYDYDTIDPASFNNLIASDFNTDKLRIDPDLQEAYRIRLGWLATQLTLVKNFQPAKTNGNRRPNNGASHFVPKYSKQQLPGKKRSPFSHPDESRAAKEAQIHKDEKIARKLAATKRKGIEEETQIRKDAELAQKLAAEEAPSH